MHLRDDSILEFSDRLKILRKQKGLTQKEIAKLIGVYQGSYANWENGKREPKLEIIVQLAKILDTTPNELLGWR